MGEPRSIGFGCPFSQNRSSLFFYKRPLPLLSATTPDRALDWLKDVKSEHPPLTFEQVCSIVSERTGSLGVATLAASFMACPPPSRCRGPPWPSRARRAAGCGGASSARAPWPRRARARGAWATRRRARRAQAATVETSDLVSQVLASMDQLADNTVLFGFCKIRCF